MVEWFRMWHSWVRLAGVAGSIGILGLSGLATAGSASAMGSANCTKPGHGVDRKGTSSGETINVNVAAGHRVVVCTGAGTDTVNIQSIADPGNPNTQLWIAFGNGAKTLAFNAGTITFNQSWGHQGFVVRPEANPDIQLSGGGADNFSLICGTNRQFQNAADGNALLAASGSRLWSWWGGLDLANAELNSC